MARNVQMCTKTRASDEQRDAGEDPLRKGKDEVGGKCTAIRQRVVAEDKKSVNKPKLVDQMSVYVCSAINASEQRRRRRGRRTTSRTRQVAGTCEFAIWLFEYTTRPELLGLHMALDIKGPQVKGVREGEGHETEEL
jgi:hypothetical protein